MKIGFTGTRQGMTRLQGQALKDMLCDAEGEFHHGDCLGADHEAHDIATELHLFTVAHPPSDTRLRAFTVANRIMEPLPYLERNRNIVRATDLLIAAPREMQEEIRSGTWSTVRYARSCGRRIWLFFPDGTYEIEEPNPKPAKTVSHTP